CSGRFRGPAAGSVGTRREPPVRTWDVTSGSTEGRDGRRRGVGPSRRTTVTGRTIPRTSVAGRRRGRGAPAGRGRRRGAVAVAAALVTAAVVATTLVAAAVMA